MSTLVAAPRRRVWSALTDPEQVVHWRPGGPRPLDPAQAYPAEGVRMRWRCRVHELPLVLHETPVSVKVGEQLRSRLSLGLFRFEENFTLTATAPSQTRLALTITARNEMPTLGGALDRFAVREFATQLSLTYLQAVRDWCEGSRPSEHPFPSLPEGVGTVLNR